MWLWDLLNIQFTITLIQSLIAKHDFRYFGFGPLRSKTHLNNYVNVLNLLHQSQQARRQLWKKIRRKTHFWHRCRVGSSPRAQESGYYSTYTERVLIVSKLGIAEYVADPAILDFVTFCTRHSKDKFESSEGAPSDCISFAPILQLMNLYCEGSETHFLLHGLADVRQGLQCNYANQMCPNNCL